MALQVQANASESTRKDEDSNDDVQETAFFSRGCCSFWSFSCWKSENWERISTSERETQECSSRSWWDKGINALREWSELVAGPKWKTFIRRFNRTGTKRSVEGRAVVHVSQLIKLEKVSGVKLTCARGAKCGRAVR